MKNSWRETPDDADRYREAELANLPQIWKLEYYIMVWCINDVKALVSRMSHRVELHL